MGKVDDADGAESLTRAQELRRRIEPGYGGRAGRSAVGTSSVRITVEAR
jgi:hypothetical protein